MTIRLTATIVPGQGDAARNNQLLIPRIATRFPEIINCRQFGTINVLLDQPLDRSRADFWTPHIAWVPASMPGAERAHRLEAFGFIRIAFECPLGDAPRAAWIMLAEGSGLTYCNDRAEIVADRFIDGVAYGAACAVHIDHIPEKPAPSWFGEIYGESLTAKDKVKIIL
jgi:hypothetical protein